MEILAKDSSGITLRFEKKGLGSLVELGHRIILNT